MMTSLDFYCCCFLVQENFYWQRHRTGCGTACYDKLWLSGAQWLLFLYLMGTACAQWKIKGSFDKVANQNSPYFSTTSPFFYFSLTKFTPIFYSPYFSIYTINKTVFLKGRSPKWKGKLDSEIGGTGAQNWGKVVLVFDSRFEWHFTLYWNLSFHRLDRGWLDDRNVDLVYLLINSM